MDPKAETKQATVEFYGGPKDGDRKIITGKVPSVMDAGIGLSGYYLLTKINDTLYRATYQYQKPEAV